MRVGHRNDSDEALGHEQRGAVSQLGVAGGPAEPSGDQHLSVAAWVHDAWQGRGSDVLVANPRQEAWKWKNVKRKMDRDDALKLAKWVPWDSWCRCTYRSLLWPSREVRPPHTGHPGIWHPVRRPGR